MVAVMRRSGLRRLFGGGVMVVRARHCRSRPDDNRQQRQPR